MIRNSFSSLKHSDEKYFRADLAFCNQDCVEACIGMGAKFTITAHGNIGWEAKVNEVTEWKAWEWSAEELEAFTAQKTHPPKIELGQMIYQPGWSANLR